jgi:magnesium transporter
MTPFHLFRRKFAQAGSPPGTLMPAEDSMHPRVHWISYDAEHFEEGEWDGNTPLSELENVGRVTWIDVQGLGDSNLVQNLGEVFGLHSLAVADVINLGQRPKAEAYGEVLYMVARMVREATGSEVTWEQFSLFLGDGWVLSFQERHGDCLDPLRDRLRQGRRLIRASGADYLAVMILDTIVDGYFPILETYGERLEDIEEQVIARPDDTVLGEIYHMKRELMHLRRSIWPMREMLNQLHRDGDPKFSEETRLYLRDVVDHAVHIVDVTETHRELAGSFVDVYLSSVSQRTNEVMQVLTVIATIFIPLTFIAGVYGMNFDTSSPWNLPELGWRHGYLLFWILCLGIGGILMVVFARLGWLRKRT